MFAPIGRAGAVKAFRPVITSVPQRTMVTESTLKARIKTVANVGKITSTMKMVSAAKLRGSQRTLDIARVFQKDVTEVWPDVKPEDRSKPLLVALCSDGGLCGAVNSSLVRAIKLDARTYGENYRILLYGNKGFQGLDRGYKEKFTVLTTDMAKAKMFTFRTAVAVCEPLLTLEYTQAKVFFQTFRSMIAYDQTIAWFFPFEVAKGDGKFLDAYEIEGDTDTLENFYQFRMAVRMFHMMCETSTSMLSSRMNAMENSSKNAGEMLKSLQLKLNRTRQARITTELIEIISGAAAAEDMQKSS